MRFTSWITKATDIHSEHVTFIALNGKDGYTNQPRVTFERTVHVLFYGAKFPLPLKISIGSNIYKKNVQFQSQSLLPRTRK